MSSRAIVILGVIGSVIFIGAGSAPIFFISYDASGVQNIGNWGQFISGLFAPVAFVWVVIAVVLQGRELELQREELKETREVLNLQKEEMKRAADETREQTRIMTDNLQREASRQVYNELDLTLYSLALFILSNSGRSRVNIGNGGFYIVDASSVGPVNKDNSDRIYIFLHRSLSSADQQIRTAGHVPFQAVQGCREFVEYCDGVLHELATEQKYVENRLALARLNGLQIPESAALLRQIRKNLFGG